jgi:phytoene dehydrogenase-like protein
MMIHLAMDGLPDWRAGAALQQFAYVHLAPSLDQMARTYQQAQAGLLPDEPILVVGQPTVFDPPARPQASMCFGCRSAWPPAPSGAMPRARSRRPTGPQAAEPFADRALDILEAHAPGTRAKILGRRIVTPAELEADNPNLSAAIRSAAATTCRSISCSAPPGAMPTAPPRSPGCT